MAKIISKYFIKLPLTNYYSIRNTIILIYFQKDMTELIIRSQNFHENKKYSIIFSNIHNSYRNIYNSYNKTLFGIFKIINNFPSFNNGKYN